MFHRLFVSAIVAGLGLPGPARAANKAGAEDWQQQNLVASGDFSRGQPGDLPEGWSAICPNPALAPRFTWVSDAPDRRRLRAEGNGRAECFGYVRHPVRFTPGKTYRLRVRLRTEGLTDVNRHLVHGVFGSFNAGYFMGLMPARAADNGVWMIVSSANDPAGVWDSGGALAGEKEPDPTRSSPSTIRSYEKDEPARILIATLDLSRRTSPAWWGGPMRSAPGGRRVRQTLMEPVEEQIAREAKRWWDE
jgi:hypothetical protein